MSQNCCNRKGDDSKYKGVCRKYNNKFEACIKYHGRRIYLGLFDDEIEAARAYDEAAKRYHGEFAVLNFEKDGHKDAKTQSKMEKGREEI
jgi:hypothetical protein